LDHYASQIGLGKPPKSVVVAAAGPLFEGRVKLTNSSWSIGGQELQNLGFTHVHLMNDFEALAQAMVKVQAGDLKLIGPALSGMNGAPVSILGAGTGFGVACLVPLADGAVPLVTEGGHIAFGPVDDEQVRILQKLRARFPRVSVERILSGAGLESLYCLQQELEGRHVAPLPAADLATRAMQGDPDCHRALSLFCSIYGAVAGDIALAHGARGGVIIAGGIALRIAPFLLASDFRSHFEAKGRLSSYVQSIPTHLLIDTDAALRGAACVAAARWSL
jgi:glucokinase